MIFRTEKLERIILLLFRKEKTGPASGVAPDTGPDEGGWGISTVLDFWKIIMFCLKQKKLKKHESFLSFCLQ